MRSINLVNQTFGRWAVLSRASNTLSGQAQWLCRCTCGNMKTLKSIVLRRGISQSCGCLQREETVKRHTKHGHATAGNASPTYWSWLGMIGRCTNPNNSAYANYGGRGVTVCARWNRFENFLADMGERPNGTSLDRVKNNVGYSPTNCRWATPVEQANNRRANRLITIHGKTKTMAQWLTQTGMTRSTVDDRIKAGWSPANALFVPAGTTNNNAHSRRLTLNGQTMTVMQWARKLRIPPQRIYQRLHRGASAKEALANN